MKIQKSLIIQIQNDRSPNEIASLDRNIGVRKIESHNSNDLPSYNDNVRGSHSPGGLNMDYRMSGANNSIGGTSLIAQSKRDNSVAEKFNIGDHSTETHVAKIPPAGSQT